MDAPAGSTHQAPAATRRTHASKRAASSSGGHRRVARKPVAQKAGAQKAGAPKAGAQKAAHGTPFLPIDAELLADLHDTLTRKLRAVVRERPYAALGAALSAGFLAGGGWRSRMGRLLLVAAGRSLLLGAVGRYLGD